MVRSSVISNPNVSPEVLREFGNNESEHVRQLIAKNFKTPIDNLKKFTKDTDPIISRYAVSNLEIKS